MSALEASRAPAPTARRTSLLDPVSRTTEVLFGLIMVLTFTATFNASEAGREDVRLLLIAAVGCSLAWGLIDGAMYLLSVRAEKAIAAQALASARASSPEAARRAIAEAVPPLVASALDEEDLERIRQRLMAKGPPPVSLRLGRDDALAALAVFLLVVLATLPIAVPFLFISDASRALWVSHAVAIGLLFVTGLSLGRQWNRPLQVGLSMVLIGVVLVAVAVALGG
jgi:VIT1/CCC1 family predicted Fe2+/Mn2+ transporter